MEIIAADSPGIVDRICTVIDRGGIGIVPTDTVYGIVCDAANEAALERIFSIKERDRGKALPVFVSDRAMLERIALIDEPLGTAIFNFWPGALTAVLLAQSSVSPLIRAGTPTVGIRIPNYPLVLECMKRIGKPIAATSANKSGEGSYTAIHRVLHDMQAETLIDVVVDAGDLPESKPSTVIDCTKIPPMILREGAIPKADIEAVFDRYFKPINY